jgi:hypothetical protein
MTLRHGITIHAGSWEMPKVCYAVNVICKSEFGPGHDWFATFHVPMSNHQHSDSSYLAAPRQDALSA